MNDGIAIARRLPPFVRAGFVSLLIHLGVALAIAIGVRSAPGLASFTIDLIVENNDDAVPARPNLAGGLIGRAAAPGPDQRERPYSRDPGEADEIAAIYRLRETAAGLVNDDSVMAPTLIVAFEAAAIDIRIGEPARTQQAALTRPPVRGDAGAPAATRAALPTQTPVDFVRAQIMAQWRADWRDERFNGRSFTIDMVLLSTGMFAYPYGRDDPWDPRAMVTNYDELIAQGHHDLIEMVESLLRAMRAAQPIELPARMRRFPVRLDLSFRLGNR